MDYIKLSQQKKKHIHKKNLSFYGFTLIETMVSISMVLVVIVAVTTAVQLSLAISSETKNGMEAQFLAKEGTEYVHNLRDSQMLMYRKLLISNPAQAAAVGWLDSLPNDCSNGTPCYINLSNPGNLFSPHSSCTAQGCPKLMYNTLTERYGYGVAPEWEITPYTREITILAPDGTQPTVEAIVVSRVWWNGRSGIKEVSYQQSLFNWIN